MDKKHASFFCKKCGVAEGLDNVYSFRDGFYCARCFEELKLNEDKSSCEDSSDKNGSALDVQVGGSHYKNFKIQPIEYIHANNMNFTDGCIIKYASRHKNKNGIEDIKKIIHFAKIIAKLDYGEDI